MKLNKEIKAKIDEYFSKISAEELYALSIRKYGFVEDNQIEIDGDSFIHVNVEIYHSSNDESYSNNDNLNKFALAA